MPMPVSLTSNSSRSSSVRLMPSRTSPLRRELDRVAQRFSSTWRRWRPSSTTRAAATSGAIAIVSARPLRRAVSATTYSRSMTSCAQIGRRRPRCPSGPASIFDRSSTSLIRSSRCEPHLAIASSASRWRRVQVAIALQQLRVAEHAVERRAQLVAHVRQELALGAGRRLGRFLREPQLRIALAPIGDVAQKRAEEIAVVRVASASVMVISIGNSRPLRCSAVSSSRWLTTGASPVSWNRCSPFACASR